MPWDKVKDRDERYGVDTKQKREKRKVIEPAEVHGEADSCWNKV